MGASTALFLARKGVQVSLFDRAPAPCSGASRWNEGKIHLGFLYAADPTLATAERLIPGGLAFKDLVEDLIGCSIDGAITPEDDVYLIHKDSVVPATVTESRFRRIADSLRQSPRGDPYLTDVSECDIRILTPAELEDIANTSIIKAGFRVPERSVSTSWIADRYVDAVNAELNIDSVLETRVAGARPSRHGALDGPWLVQSDSGTHGPYSHVVNALWEGRPAVDATVGLHPESAWTHRFRLSLFVRTSRRVDVPSAVFATGPFGDIKNYNGRDFYLSWYPAGLVAEGSELEPPDLPRLNGEMQSRVKASIWANLAELIPATRTIAAEAETVDVNGGWVFALGDGSLADPKSTLHRRDRIGVRRAGTYISVDTGKYSIAPWLARQVADEILGDIQ